jgi:predicted PolB exonuclease-like 3'-5' exonuclease
MSILFLDIATIPDFELGARLYNLHDLSEKDIARVMFTKSREKGGNSEELSQHLLSVAAVSILLQDDDGISLQTSTGPQADELQQLQFLTSIIDQHKPELITWDWRTVLPVLNFRYLSHGIRLPLAENSTVIDLLSELSESDEQGPGSLNEVAILSGFPGIESMSDQNTLNASLEGSHELICINLEIRVINTCLIYQRWQLVCGEIDHSTYEKRLLQIKEYLQKKDQTHLTNFADSLT